MGILPSFASMVDYSSMKHSIVPRLSALCMGTHSVGVSHCCHGNNHALQCLKWAHVGSVRSKGSLGDLGLLILA